MLPFKRVVLVGIVSALLPLASCANGPLAEIFQRSVEADPRLLDGSTASAPAATQSPSDAQLPGDFPIEIPRYPGAQLLDVISSESGMADYSASREVQTRWGTSDSTEQVKQFYEDSLADNNWKVEQPTADGATAQTIVAERDGLQLTVKLGQASEDTAATPPATETASPAGGTEFVLAYVQENQDSTAQSTTQSPGSTPSPSGDGFVGPVAPSGGGERSPNPAASSAGAPQTFTDISQAPEELRQYIQDLAKLGVLSSGSSGGNSSEFKPNAPITRRDYARWLAAANNALYANRPAQKIRLGVSSSQPTFQDVPRTDPDFAAIQGLAEAGLIPSPLSGDPTAVTFRPNAPLTRENLVLWKAPMDTRQTLPNATVQAVQQSWGFQDTNRIDPKALRAVLADYQNGDLSNIRRAFGYTTLFQPKKTVTRAEAAAALWFFGSQGDGVSAQDALQAQQSN